MASKLTDITTTYHTFVQDQVLTEKQLNEFIDYFEDQNRLTRISLSGAGIVCGFEPVVQTVSVGGVVEKQIRVSQGAGVTTDGDLVNLRIKGSEDPLKNVDITSMVFTNYRRFEDSNADYLPFRNNGPQFEMWEALLPEEVSNPTDEPKLTGFVGLENMVGVLYLESYADENNLCDELSCDSQGIHQVSRLRLLFLTQSNATTLLSKDMLYTKHDLMSVYLQMKDLSVPRIILGSALSSSGTLDTASQLKDAFRLSNFAPVITDLKSGMQLMSNKLTPYFPSHGIGAILASIDAKLPSAGTVPALFFQYRYDLLKDVVDTYNELKELFIELATECFPSITAFPKHLMLGKLAANESDKLVSRYRHKFYRSPILIDGATGFERFRAVLGRMSEMLKSYPTLPENTGATSLLRSEIKITPSVFRSPLGTRSVPFYYNHTSALLKAWDFEKTRKGKQTRNLSYNTSLLDTSAAVQTPLRYTLEPRSFLRIEGHQGRDYKEAMDKIDKIRIDNGLSFDLKALCVDADPNLTVDPEEYSCEFEDLSVLLKAWVNEQQCGIAKATTLISAYSLSQPGYNIHEEVYTGPIGVVYDPPIFASGLAQAETGLSQAMEGKSALAASSGSLSGKDDQLQMIKSAVSEGNKQYYGGSATVIDNLTVKQDTIGGAFLYALQNQPNGKPNDLVLAANYYADKFIADSQIEWDPHIKVILVNNSFHLLAYVQALSNSIPVSVADIDDSVIESYNTNIENLCSTLQKVQVTYTDSTTLSSKNRAILGLLINQLTSICCASKQLQALLREIDDRKDAILGRLTLKKFTEEHPGLEHFAGVEQGGTFVLVYLRKGVGAEGGVSGTPNGTVLADFSLPYMCCSDCSPINFIMPKAPVSLRLPKDVVCLGEELEVLTFQAEPFDGVIAADQEITGMIISGNELTIDPVIFDRTKLNQEIRFTVNGQVTDCRLTVKEPLEADFTVPESPATATLITFSAEGDFPAGTTFVWDFGDGMTDIGETVPHNYSLPLSGGNTVVVKLTVTPSDGSCPTIITKSFTFADLSIDLQPRTFCNNDPVKHYFTVTPAGATPTISGLGVSNADRSFSAYNLTPGSIPVSMNGVPVLTLQVQAPPTIIANGAITGNILKYTSNMTDDMDYEWQFLNASGEAVHDPVTGQANPEIPLSEINVSEGDSFTVLLVLQSNCGQVVYRKSFKKPVTQFTVDLQPREFCNTDDTAHPFIVTPSSASVTFSGPGVDSARRTFTAYNLPAGTVNIGVSNGQTITVTINEVPDVSMSGGIQQGNLVLTGNFPSTMNSNWVFEGMTGAKVHDALGNTNTVNIPLSQFNNIKAGESFIVKLSVNSPCGESSDEKVFVYQTGSGEEACRADALQDIIVIDENLRAMPDDPRYGKLPEAARLYVAQMIDFLDSVKKNPADYLDGTKNNDVMGVLKEWFEGLRNQIVTNEVTSSKQLLLELYLLYSGTFYAITQCQEESKLEEIPAIYEIFRGINMNLDPNNPDGFVPMELVIDESGEFRLYVGTVRDYRIENSNSWKFLNDLMQFLSK